ncbi:MAG: hypothetical protein AB1898_03035 [Acidobacteriota bacterium]
MFDRRLVVGGIILLTLGVVFGALLRLQPVSGSNDGSRWNTVWSLNTGHGYIVDEAPFGTVDKVRRDGHFYSSKPALLPTLLAGWAWVLKATTGRAIPDQTGFVVRTTLVLLNLVPLAVFIFFYARLLDWLKCSPATQLYCLVAAALGTYLTGYSVTLNNHTLAAIGTFGALYCYIRIRYDARTQWHYFFSCGLLAAWAVANEMVAVLLILILLGLLLRRHPSQTLKYFLPPAAVLGVAYLYTTYLSTGGLIPYYLYFNTPYYQYEGSYWTNPRGIDAAQEVKWLYLFHLTFGHHGIFSLTPIFLIAFYGLFQKGRISEINRIGLLVSVVIIGFYTFKTNNYGGVCQGARWLFWLIPFWLISMASVVEQYMQSRRFQVFAGLALFLSLMTTGFALSGSAEPNKGRPGPWSASWLHLQMREANWVDY